MTPEHQVTLNDRTSRRELFRRAAITTGSLALAALPGCGSAERQYKSDHRPFNGDVTLRRIETTEEGLDSRIKNVDFVVTFHKPGSYLLEGWVHNYRAPDSLGDTWDFTVNDAPHERLISAKSLISRLELTRVVDGKTIERDTCRFNHHGIAGSFDVQGQPTTR